MRSLRLRMIGLICIGVIALLDTACFDVWEDITYTNATQSSLEVSVSANDQHNDQFQLSPGASKSLQYLKQSWPRTVEAREPSGKVVFNRTYTWDDLKQMDFNIVIAAQSPTPIASATPP